MSNNQPPEHFTDAPLCTVNWDREEVPEGYTQRRREREQEQREQVEAQVIDWLRSQYGPLPVYRYSPHDTPPVPPEGHFRIGRDGTVTPTAPWNRDNQNE